MRGGPPDPGPCKPCVRAYDTLLGTVELPEGCYELWGAKCFLCKGDMSYRKTVEKAAQPPGKRGRPRTEMKPRSTS